jgi:hypothetical protein
MRTTLTLDPDVAADLKRRARKTGRPFRQILNDAVRAGLRAQDAPAPRPYKLKPISMGGPLPGINLDKANQLAADLEDEEIARKLALRK